MTEREYEALRNARLKEALIVCQAELTTLAPRLPEPYARNVRKVLALVKETLDKEKSNAAPYSAENQR